MHTEWVDWMQNKHIADVLATGCFKENRMSKMLIPEDPEGDGETYSLQYLCSDMATLQRYQKEFAPALQAEHTAKFEGHFVAFRSIMELLEISTVKFAENWEKN